LLSEVIEDLSEVLEKAPRMAEAQYLYGVVLTIKNECDRALELFNLAQKRLSDDEADFKHFKSFCLLKLAGNLLQKADHEGANKLFDEVVSLEVLKDRIPGVMVESRLLEVMESYRERRFEEAQKGLKSISQVEGLTAGQKKAIDVIIGSMEIMFLFTERRIDETLKNTAVFLEKWTPKGIPGPDEQTADEFLFRVVNEDELPFPASIFRSFYFLQAVVMLQLKEMKSKSLSKGETEELALPLLRALQFEPRNRDILACLGVLYFWFLPHKREKALEWLEAADNMGIEDDYIRDLLEKYRSMETERKHILERFMSLTAQFLADGSVNANIKQALAEELGQFHEFRPLLIELEDLGEIQQKSPTLQSLMNRTEYLYQLSKDITQSQVIAEKKQILSISQEYARLVKVVQSASMQIEELEKQIMKEIAKQVLQ
jgi:tetratricopeptide (TPR) repeat protein